MTIGELRALLADYPDEATIDFQDGNFGWKGDPLEPGDLSLEEDRVLIRTPLWEPVD